jgi:glycosyltransferase involved in cell wall biosynthesis
MIRDCELTILMPCLNEAETLASCIAKARSFLDRSGIEGEVLVADNGSTDGSQMIAQASGARVVDIAERGYGSALIGGIRAARGRYVIMGDSDDSYDFSNLGLFVEKLRQNYQLVMGNRFQGGIRPGAMPPLHRYFGNPILTMLGRLFFSSSCGDFYCGLRGFERRAILALDLQASGMEFALEMVVKATTGKLRIAEVPTTLSPDGRSRRPHLRSWRDGWRSLRFYLLFSPRWLFLYPGTAMFLSGVLAMIWLLLGPLTIGDISFDIHTLLYGAVAIIIGVQSIQFWIFCKIYGMREGIVPPDPWFTSIIAAVARLEYWLITGGILLLIGLVLALAAVSSWVAVGFGDLNHPERTMRLVIPSAATIILAFQIVYGAFFVSILGIRASRANTGPEHDGKFIASGDLATLATGGECVSLTGQARSADQIIVPQPDDGAQALSRVR